MIDIAASGPVVSKRLDRKLGMVRRVSTARISQADGGTLKGGKQVVNSSFKFLNSFSLSSLSKRQNRNRRQNSPSLSPSLVSLNDLINFDFNAEV